MIYKVLSIRDRAADLFSQPMFFGSIGSAVRSFSDEVQKKAENNNLNKHPEDFDLYHIADYNDETAEFTPQRPIQVAIGKDYA
ncbi:MAG: nonstructural protein [Microvirus sp.]|nr:MAG: nonstructural protein [Microvirus sp.]